MIKGIPTTVTDDGDIVCIDTELEIVKCTTMDEVRNMVDADTRGTIEFEKYSVAPMLEALFSELSHGDPKESAESMLKAIKYVDQFVDNGHFTNMCYEYFKLQKWTDEEFGETNSIRRIMSHCNGIRNKSEQYRDQIDTIISEIHERLIKIRTLEGAHEILSKLSDEITPSDEVVEEYPF